MEAYNTLWKNFCVLKFWGALTKCHRKIIDNLRFFSFYTETMGFCFVEYHMIALSFSLKINSVFLGEV